MKKNGDVSQNLFALFGLTQNTHSFALGTATTDVISEIIEAVEKAEDELGAYQGLARGYKLIAGKNIHRKIVRHAKVEKGFRVFQLDDRHGRSAS